MVQAISGDLRCRIISHVEAGHSRRSVARHFGVSDSFAVKLLQRWHQKKSYQPDRRGAPKGKGKLAACRAFIIAQVEKRPDITMPGLCDLLFARHWVRAQLATLSRLLYHAGYTYKKTLMAAEQDRSDVRAERVLWITYRRPRMALEHHRLILIAEMSVNTKMTRLHGKSKKGTKCPEKPHTGTAKPRHASPGCAVMH